MSAIGNLLWLICGGLIGGILWLFAAAIMAISVVGIPWVKSCLTMAELAFIPFGKEVIERDRVTGDKDIGTGSLGLLGNVVWFCLAGIWLALLHAIAGILCATSIIGIPFAIQHFKLASLAIAPVGKTIVPKHIAAAAHEAEAEEYLEMRRRKRREKELR